MSEPLDILAVSPHPDDAELGCAGSLMLATDKGLRIAVADLTEGERSSRGTVEERVQAKKKAGELMGLWARFSLGLPDTEIGTAPTHRLAVIQIIRETRPRIVLSPYLHDRHPDHAAACKLVQDACFFAGVAKVGEGRPHRPERLYYYMLHYLTYPFTPSFVIDISPFWERKLAVLAAYGSQFQLAGDEVKTAISRPEFMRFIEVKAAWFGAMIGVAYGEGFYTPGPVPLTEFPGVTEPRPLPDELPFFRMY